MTQRARILSLLLILQIGLISALCPKGNSCNVFNEASTTACGSDEYSPEGHFYCYTAPPGFTPNTGDASGSVQRCYDQNTAAPYSNYFEGTGCTTCPAGFSCSAQIFQMCPNGQRSPAGSNTCSACATACPDKVNDLGCSSGVTGAFCTGTFDVSCSAGFYLSGASCLSCPSGQYCVGGTIAPVNCPDGTYATGSARYYASTQPTNSACTVCPAGKNCISKTVSPPNCAGYSYSLLGFKTCVATVAGEGFTSISTLPVKCAPGTYSVGGAACLDCDAGYYCADPTITEQACPTGWYSPVKAKWCTPCPGGALCTASGGVGTACSPGQYVAPETYATSCNSCPANKYCPSLFGPALTCPPGYKPAATPSSCDLCAAGTICPLGYSGSQCSAGQYSPAGATACLPCPDGYECPVAGTGTPIACAAGTYQNAAKTDCTACEENYECPTGHSASRVQCATGRYSATSQPICSIIGDNQICPTGKATNLATCAAGNYINGATCDPCPAGSYCPSIFAVIPCPDGTYATTGKTKCTICPAGSQCPNKDGTLIAVCSDGSYALPGSMACTPCSLGHYCPYKDRPLERECDAGYYAPIVGKKQCDPCPANMNCKDKKTAVACPTHYYALQGFGECRPCPAGQLCNGGPIPVDCSAGTYSPEGDKDCHTCPIGTKCAAKASRPSICPPGTYAAAGSSTCSPCSAGNFAREGAGSCTPCPAGFYCPIPQVQPIKCGHGQYSSSGATSCSICNAGYPCTPGAVAPSPATNKCPRGAYCPIVSVGGVNVVTIKPCPEGYFGSAEGAIDQAGGCSICTAGNYCPLQGMTVQRPCPKGAYCVSPFTSVTLCTAGTYNPQVGQSSSTSCVQCPAGTYCPEGSSEPLECVPGAFCPAGSATPDLSKQCPAGKYSSTSPITQSSDCINCPAGAYCPQGSGSPKMCPPGTFNPNPGSSLSTSCGVCSAGQACPKYGNIKDNGVPCAPGYYCPAGTQYPTQYPCPAGKYSDTIDAVDSTTCLPCPEGWYCLAGTNRFTNPMIKCPPGYYCLQGTDSANKYPCDAGKYFPFTGAKATGDCLYSCPPGKYCPAGSANPAGDCKDGYYCPEASFKEDQNPCPQGTYSPSSGLKSANECIVCPAGYYCPAASKFSTIVPCATGTYNPSTGKWDASHCLACSAGYYCPSPAATEQLECGYGKYSGPSATVCTPCKETYYCNTPTTPEASITGDIVTCAAGYICPTGVAEYPAASLLCQEGYYCVARAVDPTPCLPGTYNPSKGGKSSADCVKTPAGKYSLLGSARPTGDCAPGFYCPEGSIRDKMVPCPVGTFRSKPNGAKVEDCGPCPAGYFCPIGCAEPRPCPVGMFCLPQVTKPDKCPMGYFGASPLLRSSSQCTACWSGRFCSVGGLSLPDGECDPGYYCIKQSYVPNPTDGTSGNLCPAGGVCPKGSKAAQPCLPGTYSDTAGMKSTAECKPCTQGSYCIGEVKNGVSGSCKAGYYCPTGAATERETAAAPGYYTLAGAWAQVPCNPGYYNPDYAQTTCISCPEGYLCLGSANTGSFTDCPAGNFCPLHSSVGTPCLAGTYSSVTRLHAAADCTPCPPGKYCSGGSSSTSGSTNAGVYSKHDGSLATSGTQCLKGYYCPPGSGNPTPCPAGTYNPSLGSINSGACQSCSSGKYCSKNGLEAPEGDCDVGYYCPGGATSPRPSATACTTGQYCPAGSSAPLSCLPGYYQDSVKQGSCKACPKGFFCGSGSVTFEGNDCPAGYYCPEATQSGTQFACPAGTYNPNKNAIDPAQCLSCPPGYYCTGTGRTAVDPAALCMGGYYCILGAKVSNPTDSTGGQCQPGYYCPSGTSYPMPCPPGKACPNAGMSADAGACDPGYYCTLMATTKTPTTSAQGGGACAPGYYCPSGSMLPIPCPVGTFSGLSLRSALSDCAKCDDGYYCDQLAATLKTATCDAGYYCKKDATMLVGFRTPRPADKICPKGYYCTAGTLDKQPCGANDYQDMPGSSSCLPCPAGYWCDADAKHYCKPGDEKVSYYCPPNNRNKVSCGDGKYNVQPGTFDVTDCKSCPPGKYCPVNPSATESKINICPAGRYCPLGSGTSMGSPCTPGNYCPAGSAAQIPCPPGKYCDVGSLSETDLATRDCTAGYHCIGSATTPTPNDITTGVICPTGNYCPTGTKEPVSCPPGTYRGTTGGAVPADCTKCTATQYCPIRGLTAPALNCPPGYYCPIGTAQDKKFPCEAGYKCPAGSAMQTLCPDGTYQPLPVQDHCEPCPARYFCKNVDAASAQQPVLCPKGKYCTGPTQPQDCSKGTFNPNLGMAAQSECEDCPPGKICDSFGLIDPVTPCTQGYFCVRGVSVNPPPDDATGGKCPLGHYCPSGTASPIACPPGTINDALMGTSSANCLPCPTRYYCPYRGKSSADYFIGVNDNFYCDPGYLCLTGSKTPTPTDGTKGRKCDVGKYCIKGALAEQPCTPGNYNPYTAQGSCIPCPPGRLCPNSGMSTYNDCPMMVFCAGGNSVGTPCPAGTYNPTTNLESADQCYPCDPGKYCVGGKAAPDGPCAQGYVCFRGAKVDTSTSVVFQPTVNTEGMCPKGHYCLAGSKSPTQCAVGTYQDTEGQSSCKLCPIGRYCDKTGIVDPSANLCAAGFICISGSATPSPYLDVNGGHQCSVGKYCPAGTTSELPCLAGTYEPRVGSAACQACPPGFYCPAGCDTPVPCTIKHFCPLGTSTPQVCPPGTYSNVIGLQSSDQCRPCKVGFYCLDGEMKGQCNAGYYCEASATSPNDPAFLCPIGHYCEVGCLTPVVCEQGKVRSTPGATKASDCTDCDSGYYCVAGVSTPFDCPKGHYCPTKSQQPTPCPAGTYNSLIKQPALSNCLPCPPGYNCTVEGIADLSQYKCPVGHYCANSNVMPVFCPNGTFSNITGMSAKSDCYPCLFGFYCLEGTVTPTLCAEGTYCPIGSSSQTDCPAGFYCKFSVLGGNSISYPRDCPGGYYCPAKTVYPIKCSNGYYCPPRSPAPTPCPSGAMGNNNEYNDDVSTGCMRCPPGTYSVQTTSSVAKCEVCLAGYVCTSNTSSRTPVDPDKDGGYVCPKGYYCPEGSYEPTPCPVGTFGNHSGAVDSSACMYCEDDSYNDLEGQPGCKPCGPTSHAGSGSSSCTCMGENRVFQMADGKCVCKQYYTSLLENDEEDSQYDCRPLLQESCKSGYLRDTFGKCVARDSCEKECRGGKGKRTPGIGMCECESIQEPDSVCNATCRAAAPSVSVNSKGQLVFPNKTTINTSSLKIAGEPTCYTGGCKLVSLSVASSGFAANYQPSSKLIQAYAAKRMLSKDETRLLGETNGAIINPAMCISQGDTITFDLSGSHYPVYLKDAMANSNPNFDYSVFLDLAKRIGEGEALEMFVYTFYQPGIYVFGDNQDQTQQTIITVMDKSQRCPSDGKYILPVTASNLMQLGMAQNEDITLEPNWVFIGCSFIVILVLFPGVIVLITYLHNKSWREKAPASIGFKRPDETGKKPAAVPEASAVSEISRRPLTEEAPMISNKSIIQIRKEQTEGEVDPNIFEEIYRELKQHSEYVKTEFAKKTGQDSANIAMVWAAMRQLKKFVKGKLKSIAKIFGKDIKYMLSGPKKAEEGKSEESKAAELSAILSGKADMLSAEQEEEVEDDRERLEEAIKNKELKDAADVEKCKEDVSDQNKDFMKSYVEMQNKRLENFKEGLENSKLTDGDKHELLKEYEKQLQRLQKQLLLEQQDIQPQLQQRIEARRNKRAELMKKKDELDYIKRGVKAEFKEKSRQIDEALRINTEKVNSMIDAEIQTKEAEFEAVRNDNQAKLKAKFDAMLRKTSDAQKRTEILEMFEKASKDLDRMYEDEQKQQLQGVKEQLEKRRRERHNELKTQADKDREDVVAARDASLKKVQESEILINNQLSNAGIDEKSQEAYEADQQKTAEEAAELEKLANERDEELKRIAAAEHEKLAIIKEESAAEEEKLKADNEVQKRILAHKTKKKSEDLTKKKETLLAKLGEPGLSEDRKNKLKAEVQRIDEELQRRIEEELKKQDEEFQRVLAQKRQLRAAKEKDIRSTSLGKRAAVEETNSEKVWQEREKARTERYRRLMEELKTRMSESELPVAVEKLIDQSQIEELSALLSRQYQQKAKLLSARMGDLIEEKLVQTHKVKDALLAELEKLKEEKDAGTLSPAEYDRRLKDLQARENDQLRDLELEHITKQNALEEELFRSVNAKNEEELLQLKERQHREKLGILNNLALTNRHAMAMVKDAGADLVSEMEEYRKQLAAAKERRMHELEKKKQRLQTIAMENEDKIKAFNTETQRLVDEVNAKEAERLQRRRLELEEARRKQEEDIRNRSGINEEERKRIMAEYTEEFNALISAMEAEHKRQAAQTLEKLEKRMGDKEKLKLQKQIQLALYNKELEEDIESKIRQTAIRMDTKVEVKDAKEKLTALVAQSDAKKRLFYKKPPLVGVENVEELEKIREVMWQEGGDRQKETDVDEFLGTMLDIDFDQLLRKLEEMQKRVESFADGNFNQLIDGFRKINSRLNELKHRALKKKQPSLTMRWVMLLDSKRHLLYDALYLRNRDTAVQDAS